jgi:hypothetical protein
VFVVVDNDGKNRLVGCSLVSREKVEDYAWVLQQLLNANDNLPPHVILVDGDYAMEAACDNIIESTVLLNCIWHLGHQNLSRNLQGALGRDWDAFISAFWTARNSVTDQEFELRWKEDVEGFGANKPSVQAYLGKIFERREHWAWPWVGSRFTAGMQSTQRIESINSVVKRVVNSKSSLPSLFNSIENMLADQVRTSRYLHFRLDTTSDPSLSVFIRQMFLDILNENNKYLGIAANSGMKMEMMRSIHYRSNPYEPEAVHEYAAECLDEQSSFAETDEVRYYYYIYYIVKKN